MPNLRPVSDLINYTDVFKDIAIGEPVFLTKNGRGRYAVIDIEEYERMRVTLKLMSELASGERSGKKKGWTDIDTVERMLGIKNG